MFIFGCGGASFLLAGFSLLGTGRSCSLLWCAGFSPCWLLLLQSVGSRAGLQQLRLMGLVAPWNLPGPGIASMTPSLAHRFLITGPPGKSFLRLKYIYYWLPGGSVVKNLLANAGDMGLILGWEEPLEERMATHSSILVWKIPRIEEHGGLQSMGSQSQTTEHTRTHTYILHF